MQQSQALQQQKNDKKRVGNQIALEQPPGLLPQSINPFQSIALHPLWSVLDLAHQVAESSADADEKAMVQLFIHLINPLLLLGCAQRDPDDIGFVLANLADKLFILII